MKNATLHRSPSHLLGKLSVAVLPLTLAACGGGNDSAAGGNAEHSIQLASMQSVAAVPEAAAVAVENRIDGLAAQAAGAAPMPSPANVLPVPANIANGSTVNLQCGKTYQGTLQLNGKSNVTVQTSGTCGKASISPGSAVNGWTVYQGNIYSAPISFTPVQVSIAGVPLSAAHWPNSGWSSSAGAVPNSDLNGATLVYLANQSVIQSRVLTGNSVGTSSPFYVEGKLWMLDSPGEWAVQNGRLYVRAPDNQSPQGRIWAAPASNGINADNSSGIRVNNVIVFSAMDGISANTSTGLNVLSTDIINLSRDGIWASGSNGMTVSSSNVTNARRNGIDGWYSVNGAKVTNTNVANTGMVNMPTPSDAGIFFGDGANNTITGARVTNSSYHGISVLHNRTTTVSNSVVDTACVRLTDCGGIYTGARDQLPLNLKIQGNTVSNVQGVLGIGIYLDDYANGVTVTQNTVSNNMDGIFVHNGFNNIITYNTVSASRVNHLKFSQDGGTVRNNQVTNNKFNSTLGEFTYNLETGSNLKTFASFDYNTYTSNNVNVFGRTWDGHSAGSTTTYSGWKTWSGQDVHSTMNGR